MKSKRVPWILSVPMLVSAACAAGSRAPAVSGPAAPPRALDRVVVISVDGLQPAAYIEPDARGLAVPMLREMVRMGAAASPGARSVLPSVTYPAHTTIATGVPPSGHGIVTNVVWDPEEKNQLGWWWYAEDIKAPTIWDAAAAAGLTTALVNWPVTVGARANWLVPEYWRASTGDDSKLTRALSTPGLLSAVAARHPDLWKRFTPPMVADDATIDIVVHLLETARPNLLLAHIWQTDDVQHSRGPWSPEARAAMENADRQIARVVAASRSAGAWERTAIVVVSDHGFTTAERLLRPGVMLRERGLVTLGPDNHPSSWKVTVNVNGGMAFFYLADRGDESTRRSLLDLLRGLQAKPASGVGRVFEAAEVRARGGDPRADVAAEAAPGFSFERGYHGDAYRAATAVGQHGFDPERPEMFASLIVFGGAIAPTRLEGVGLVDVAPTVAKLLGFSLPSATGRALPVLRSAAGRAD